jgi:transcriptional regulator with XRE-family HTH domain
MAAGSSAAQIRTRRKLSGLTQREIAFLLGSESPGAVSKHERSDVAPSLPLGLGYEIIFGEPISKLFEDLYASIERNIECRAAELQERLGKTNAKGQRAAQTAKKLEFLCMRLIPDSPRRNL